MLNSTLGTSFYDLASASSAYNDSSVAGASSQSLGASVENRRSERDTEDTISPLSLLQNSSVFASSNVGALNRDRTTTTDGFDSISAGGVIGADSLVTKSLLVGVGFNYTNTNGDFDRGGDYDTNIFGGIIYSSFMPDFMEGVFTDVNVAFSRSDYSVDRSVSSGTASSDPEADQISAGFLFGYDHSIGGFSFGPRVGLSYLHTHIDSFTETVTTGSRLKNGDQDISSLTSTFGMSGSFAISQEYGVLVPQFTANYTHEFMDQYVISAQLDQTGSGAPRSLSFKNDNPVRDYFTLGLGLVAILPNGLQPFVNFDAWIGNSQFDQFTGVVGLRLEIGRGEKPLLELETESMDTKTERVIPPRRDVPSVSRKDIRRHDAGVTFTRPQRIR